MLARKQQNKLSLKIHSIAVLRFERLRHDGAQKLSLLGRSYTSWSFPKIVIIVKI